jgi:hypothetical protein
LQGPPKFTQIGIFGFKIYQLANYARYNTGICRVGYLEVFSKKTAEVGSKVKSFSKDKKVPTYISTS